MPQYASYTCTDVTCDAYEQVWIVELDDGGAPHDEADARCPDCYGPGAQAQAAAA